MCGGEPGKRERKKKRKNATINIIHVLTHRRYDIDLQRI